MADFKFRNAWSNAARTDARYRDRLEALELELPELVDQAAAELPPAAPADPPPAVAATWGTFHTDRKRKITAAVLAAAIEMHRQGVSWPAAAAELGVHRQSLYFARKRSGGNL